MSKRVAVIGGGISGLAAANRLAGSGCEVTLFEARQSLGGKISTEYRDGFTIENGADSFVASRARILTLCHELGLDPDLVTPDPQTRGAFIYRRGTLYPIPEGFSGLVPTKFGPIVRTRLLSPLGKFRMLLELGLPVDRETHDESLEHFVVRRFGREAYHRMLEPLLAGISSSDGNTVSLAATFPHWRTAELEYGSVVKGILAARSGASEKPRISGFVSMKRGMGTLVDALGNRLRAEGATVRLNTAVTRIDQADRQYQLEIQENGAEGQERFDGVIVAVPSWIAAALLDALEPLASSALREIPQRSSAVVALGYDNPAVKNRLNGTGYLSPAIENRVVSGVTYSSQKWTDRAPGEASLIRCFFGRGSGAEVMDEPDEVLIREAQAELRHTVGITEEPSLTHVTRWQRSMPQYTLGHLDRVAVIEQSIGRHPGLAVAGNMLRGVGVPICVQSGEAAADLVHSALADS